MKTPSSRFSGRTDDNPCTIGGTLGRYCLWLGCTMLVALVGMVLSMALISRSAATEAQDMHFHLIAILCTGLPVLFFALFFLLYKREDPCKARFYGILAAILLMILVGIFVPAQNAYYIDKAARLSVDAAAFEAERKTGMDVFSVLMFIPVAAMYFIGPFRLLMKERRQRNKTAGDFAVH